MPSDPEKSRVLNELSQAADEAAAVERVLADTHGFRSPAFERRVGERRAGADRRFADRRAQAQDD
jgi:hypothetical protein